MLDPRDRRILSMCKEPSRNSSVLVKRRFHLMSMRKLQSSILIFTDFKSRLEASKIKAIERILVCEFLMSLNLKSFFQYWEYDVHMHRTIFFTFVLVMVSNHTRDTFGDASFNGIVSALLASKNRIPQFCFPLGSLSSCNVHAQ